MTSKEHITQLVGEAVEKRKGLTLKKNDHPQKENCHTRKRFTKKQFQNWRYSFVIIKTLLQVSRFEVSIYFWCVIVNFQPLVQFSFQNKHGLHS